MKRLEDIEIVGGHPAVNFVNTLSNWTTEDAEDYLDGFDDYLRWCEISGWDGATLEPLASRPESEKRAAFDELRQLRLDLHAILSAMARGDPAPERPLERFNAQYRRAVQWLRFKQGDKGVVVDWEVSQAPASAALAPLVWQAAELIRTGPLDRLKWCPADDCGWLFLDLSRNRSRQWCSMSTCGNAAKVRRFRKRSKQRRTRTSRTSRR